MPGYFEGTSLQAIDGFSLTNENYHNAWNLLQERYGNPQLITSCHVNNLIELEAISGSNAKDLRDLFDKTKINVRALKITSIQYTWRPSGTVVDTYCITENT